MCDLKYIDKKTQIIYLKAQIFLFFSERSFINIYIYKKMVTDIKYFPWTNILINETKLERHHK